MKTQIFKMKQSSGFLGGLAAGLLESAFIAVIKAAKEGEVRLAQTAEK